MDLTQSDDDDNGDIDSNGGSTIDLTMSDSERLRHHRPRHLRK